MNELESLKKQVDELRGEKEALKLQLENAMLLLRREMIAAGKLEKPSPEEIPDKSK